MSDNPFSPPQPTNAFDQRESLAALDSATIAKVQAIIKDARQFWLAILICFLCSGLGMIIIAPWYLVRLSQWSSIADRYPAILVPNPPSGSIEQQFQSAKTKLIIGLVFGVVMTGILILAVLAMSATKPQ